MATNNAINIGVVAGGGYTYTFPSGTSTLSTISLVETLTNKDLSSGTNTFPTFNQNTTGSAATLTTARTIWGQSFNGSANVTGTLALGTSSLTLTGSIGATSARATKVWTTDIESTNMPTVSGTSLSSTFAAQGANSDITSLSGLTTALSVSQGGTGASTLTGLVLGNGTAAFTSVTAPTGTIVGTTDTQTLTNKTLTAPVISSISNTGTLTLPTSTDTLVGRATTDTLTNKQVTLRTSSTTSTATLTPDKTTYDQYILTAQAAALTIANPSTMAVGDIVAISILDNATAQTISFGTDYAGFGQALPTTTTASKWMEITLKKVATSKVEVLWANEQ